MGAVRARSALLAVMVGVGILTLTANAAATHPRPKGATPLRVSLVPAYNACTSPNRTHGPPLAFPSCNPPAQASSFLTVGTPDANGATANSVGFASITVVPPSCCPPQNVTVAGQVTDVQCKAGVSTCGAANTSGGADYTGELQSNAMIRITDHNSGPSFNEPATVVDIPFPVPWMCFSTADPSIGATCNINTSTPVAIGSPQPSTPARAVVEITQWQLFDGGADGTNSTTPNGLFAAQGLFIP